MTQSPALPSDDGARHPDAQQPTDQVLDSLHGWPNTEVDSTEILRMENEQLREALDSRAVIEQAKGALVLRYGIPPDRAFGVLRRWSQDRNIKLRTIAEALIAVSRGEGTAAFDADLVGWLQETLDRAEVPPSDPIP
ncbi:MAG: ANTAR domain-containing protein [Nocardioidaceae bacterium]